jgi:hypothetical protein
MNKMRILIKISFLLLITLSATYLSAQNPDCYIKKTYPARPGMALRISGKYGDVNFMSNKSDSISICASVTIDQDNKELIRKSIGLVSININMVNDTVFVSTNFDKKFFSETYRYGRKSFSADILIKAPAFIDIDIVNEFGNVTVDELSGIFNVRLSYGIISATKLTRGNSIPISSITVDNGKVDIDALNWMSANIRNCSSFEIGKAQALMINSDFSKIRIRDISSMVADSRSDIYTIDSLKNIISESMYTSLKIEKLYGKLFSKVIHGSLDIGDLQHDFNNIDITSDNALINIETGDDVPFRSDIVAINSPVEFSIKDKHAIIKNEGNNSVTYTGFTGKNSQIESVIKIRSTSGKVTIK